MLCVPFGTRQSLGRLLHAGLALSRRNWLPCGLALCPGGFLCGVVRVRTGLAIAIDKFAQVARRAMRLMASLGADRSEHEFVGVVVWTRPHRLWTLCELTSTGSAAIGRLQWYSLQGGSVQRFTRGAFRYCGITDFLMCEWCRRPNTPPEPIAE